MSSRAFRRGLFPQGWFFSQNLFSKKGPTKMDPPFCAPHLFARDDTFKLGPVNRGPRITPFFPASPVFLNNFYTRQVIHPVFCGSCFSTEPLRPPTPEPSFGYAQFDGQEDTQSGAFPFPRTTPFFSPQRTTALQLPPGGLNKKVRAGRKPIPACSSPVFYLFTWYDASPETLW